MYKLYCCTHTAFAILVPAEVLHARFLQEPSCLAYCQYLAVVPALQNTPLRNMCLQRNRTACIQPLPLMYQL